MPLFVGAYGDVPWPANCKGSWGFTAPGSSWIFEADLANVNHTVYGGFTNFVSIGILNKDGSGPGGWAYADANSGPISLQPTAEYAAMSNAARRVCTTQTFTNGQICPVTPRSTAGYVATAADGGNIAFFGLQNSVGGTYPSDQRAYVYGVTLLFGDAVKPTVPTMTGVPTGWVGNAPFNLTLSSSENGLGIAGYDVSISASSYSNFFGVACTYAYTAPFAPCKWSPPPTTAAVSTTVPDGLHTVSANARTPVLSGDPGPPATLKIDTTKPTIAPLSGTLTGHSTTSPLTDASYALHIDASDGDASVGRSGVKSITVSVSNTVGAADTPQTFTNTTCLTGNGGCSTTAKSADFTYNVSATKPGLHTVTVTAVDAAGNPSNPSTFQFLTLAPASIDTTTLGLERYQQYDSTPTGPGSTAYVNVANANLVWQQHLLNNPGRGLNTFATLTYNDQQPSSGLSIINNLANYGQVGQGFSLGISGITRVNEPLAIDQLAGNITLTDPDGTQHLFTGDQTNKSLLADLGQMPKRYTAPPGVHLRLRRFRDSGNQTWAATRPDGATYYFNASGYATSIQDRNGNTLTFTYDFVMPALSLLPMSLQAVPALACDAVTGLLQNIPSGFLNTLATSIPVCTARLRTVTDAGGRDVAIAYNSAGSVDRITDHAGHVTKFAYDTTGTLLQSVTSADGTGDARTHRFAYSAPQLPTLHRDLVAICDPRSPQGQACSTSTSNTTVLSYSAIRSLSGVGAPVLKLTDRNGHATSFEYLNTQGQHYGQTNVTDARSDTTTYTLDTLSRPTLISDALQRKTELAWDAANNLTGVTRAKSDATDEATTNYTFNANGLMLTKTDPQTPDGQRHTTTLTYFDSAGNQQSAVAGGEDTLHPDYVSDLKSVTTPRGSVANDTYTTDFDYGTDGRGNLQKVTEPLSTNALTGNQARGIVTATYDSSGQTLTQTDETGNLTTYPSYDANGLPLVRVDPRGNEAAAHNQDPNVGRWLYSYDPVGNLLTTTDPRGATTSDPTTNRAGTRYTTTYSYDNLDRVVTAEIPRLSDASPGSFVHRRWIYDANDNPTTFADAVGFPQLPGTTVGDAASSAAYHTDYTAMDLPAQQRTPAVAHAGEAPAPEVTELGYDAVDNLTSVKAPMAAGKDAQNNPFPAGAYTTTLGYDVADQRTTVTRQQVVGSTTNKLTTSMAYDKRGNVIGVADPVHNAKTACAGLTGGAVQAATTTTCQRYRMVYDKADNLQHQFEDPSGLNRDTGYTYFEDDALKTITDPRAHTSTYSYDERGQKTSATNAAGDQTGWQYDLAGRLGKLTKPNGTATSTVGDYQTVYTYDPDGYLTDQTVPRAAGQYPAVSPAPWSMHYVRNAVGDATTVTDPRGHAFDNTYFDTGELHTTGRPSLYAFAGPGAPGGTPQAGQTATAATTAGGSPEITQLSYDELVAQANGPEAPLPSTPGEGASGAVAPLPIPGVVPRAGTATFEYDQEMRLNAVSNVHPTTNLLSRDALGRVTAVTQPLITAPSSEADQIQRSWTYDRDGNVASFDSGDHDTTGVEATSTYGYDQFDRLASTSIPGSATNHAPEITSYGYDDNDNLHTTTTPLGHVTTLDYDAVDRLTARTDATNRVTGYGYNDALSQTTTTTPRGMALSATQRAPYTTTRTYNPADELANVKDGLNNTTSYTYDHDANQLTQTAPGSPKTPGGADILRVTNSTYDGRDLLWANSTDDGLGTSTSARTTVTEYDANGNLRRTVNAKGVGATGLPTTSDDGESAVTPGSTANLNATVREYDANGLLTNVDQPKGANAPTGNDDHLFRTDFGYTNAGFITSVSLPYDATVIPAETPLTTTYVHYENGWIRSASDPSHVPAAPPGTPPGTPPTATVQTLAYAYDHRGHQTSWTRDAKPTDSTPPSEPSRTIARTFATDGVLLTRSANKGGAAERAYSYAHDADGRLLQTKTEIDPGLGRAGKLETFTYDDADRLLTAKDPFRSTDTALTYNSEGLVWTRKTDGNLSGTTYTGGKTATFTYDALDRQQQIDVVPSDGPNRTTTFDYWNSGDQQRKTVAIAPVTIANGVKHEDYYDAAGQIIDHRRANPSATVADQTYTYDANGNRTLDDKGGEAYNSRNQLIKWTRNGTNAGSVVYTLNGAGAVKHITDSVGPDTDNTLRGDRLLNATTIPQGGGTPVTSDYSYDGFGNLLTIHQPGQADTTYTYDAFERMIKSVDPSATQTAYSYDGLDRRDTKTENARTTTYGYVASTNDLAIETTADTTTGANVTKRSYDYDTDGNRQGQQAIAPSTTTAYRPYATDAQGSVQGLEDTTGAIPNGSAYSYDPYGNPLSTGTPSQASQDNPFRFQGFYYDPTAGGYNALAREYRPDIQRFLTQDRYEAAGADLQLAENSLTGDRYAFVAGNPTSNIEDDGHLPKEFIDNQTLKGDPSQASTRRQTIGGFNVSTPLPRSAGRETRVAAATRVGLTSGRPHALFLQQLRMDESLAQGILDLPRLQLNSIRERLGQSSIPNDAIESETGDTLFVTSVGAGPLARAITGVGGIAARGLGSLARVTGVDSVLGIGGRAATAARTRGQAVLSRLTDAIGRIGGPAAKAGTEVDHVVLGHFPAYVDAAANSGGRTFQVPKHIWDAWSPERQWAANQKFLDRAIARGSEIRLATPANAAREGSFYERELQYLTSKGYRPNEGGTRMAPPGG